MKNSPLDLATMIGAQASSEQCEKILSYLDIGKQDFGPVLPVTTFKDEEEALAIATTTTSRRRTCW